jgi:hypothetical protein
VDSSEWVPAGIDVSRPSSARVYDYFLGGAHNFAVDRELAEQIAAMTPNLGETMRANRAFLRRAVRYLVGQGVRQFLDVGSGIPTAGNVHEVAQAEEPGARVLYVDVDPVAVEHSRAILSGNDLAGVLRADLRDPERILAEVRAGTLLDLDQPVAVLLAGVLHFVGDDEDPAGVVAALGNSTCTGSYLVISHATADGQPPEAVEAQRLSGRTGTAIVLRPHARIAGYFAGFDLVEPGLVFIPQWRPDPAEPAMAHPERVGAYAGIGRKD